MLSFPGKIGENGFRVRERLDGPLMRTARPQSCPGCDVPKIFGILDLKPGRRQPLDTAKASHQAASHCGQCIGVRPFLESGSENALYRLCRMSSDEIDSRGRTAGSCTLGAAETSKVFQDRVIIRKSSSLKSFPCNLKQLAHLASCLVPNQVIPCARRVFGGLEPGTPVPIRLRGLAPFGRLIEQGIQQFAEPERATPACKRPRGIGIYSRPKQSARMAVRSRAIEHHVMHEDGGALLFREKQCMRQNTHGHPVTASREVLVNLVFLVRLPGRMAVGPCSGRAFRRSAATAFVQCP